MIYSVIRDGKGSDRTAFVDSQNSLLVSNIGLPPEEIGSFIRPYRDYLRRKTDNSYDMRVDGSISPIDFEVGSSDEGDRYIDSINFLISDAGATLSEFGNYTALTNGCRLYYEDPFLGTVVIHEALRTNWDFARLCNGNPPIGGGTSAFQAANISGVSEGYTFTLDFSQCFGMPWGVRIPKNSNLRLVFEINDAIPNVDVFDIIVYGFDRILPITEG